MPALVFGAGTGDNVDIGTGASITSLNPLTYILLVNPTSFTSGFVFMQKGRFAGAGGARSFSFDSAGTGFVRFQVHRATTNTNYIANNNALVVNVWHWVAVTFDSAAAAGEVVNMYVGTRFKPITECTYGTATDGSGAVNSDSTSMRIGNDGGASPTSAFNGNIAIAGIFNRKLDLPQIRKWTKQQTRMGGLVGWYYLGVPAYAGGTQYDLSNYRNNGTTTGATFSRNPELDNLVRPDFSPRRRQVAFVAAAGGRIWSLAGDGGGLTSRRRGLAA